MKDKELKIDETIIEKNFFGITRYSQECINVVKQINQAFKENKSGLSIQYTCYDNIDYSLIEFLYKKLLIPMQEIGLIFIAWLGNGYEKFSLHIRWEEIKSECYNSRNKLYSQIVKFAMKNHHSYAYIPIAPFRVYWNRQVQIRTLLMIMNELPNLYNWQSISFDGTNLIKNYPDQPIPKYAIFKLSWSIKEHYYRSKVFKYLEVSKDIIENLITTLNGDSKKGIIKLCTDTNWYSAYEFQNDIHINFPFHLSLADELKVIRYLNEKIPNYRRFGGYEFRYHLPKFPYYLCKSLSTYATRDYNRLTKEYYNTGPVTRFTFIIIPDEKKHKLVYPTIKGMACSLIKRGDVFFTNRCDIY